MLSWTLYDDEYEWYYEGEYDLEDRTLSVWISVDHNTPDAQEVDGRYWLPANSPDEIQTAVAASTRAYLGY